ncbi:hypothetical protein BGW36DRAFT_416984 [Talaromyces proteolyticus]|uniref:Uncharacterized protein n=1 Tax=Talaromyces proteolyticus TaxID=1131652 RepID=A0AAD4KS41_9EURO|nr:uncharacterized protein BGW36DRAFT_416984 [Talaromyces proteolyticus]KAH8697588.1 hypothetical protein BGW36DRAFT_416984 [Talaromyces proteolyticus]
MYAGQSTTPHGQSVSSDEIKNEETFVESTLQWIPSRPLSPRVQGEQLEKPVVIPRLDVVGGLKAPLPFLRAYSPVLHAHDIHETEFLAFIDNLTVAQAGSPVFQAMNVAGMGVGYVPHHWFQLAGIGIQVAAGVGTAAVATIRTKKFLAVSNEKFFAPRGLKVSLKKDQDVASMVGYPLSQRLLSSAQIGPNTIIGIRDRRMAVLAPYIATLTTDVPPPTKQRNILDRIAAKQKEKDLYKEACKSQANSNSSNSDSSDSESSSSDSSIANVDSKIAKLDREIQTINRKADSELLLHGTSKSGSIEDRRSKELAKVQRKKDRLERKLVRRTRKTERKTERKARKSATKKQEKDSKLEKKVNKMEYIVVERLHVQ